MKHILVAAGHGSLYSISPKFYDKGAIAPDKSTCERDVVYKLANDVGSILKSKGYDVTVMTSTKPLTERIKWLDSLFGTKSNFDLAIELHLDSASPQATGATIFADLANKAEKDIATKIINKYCQLTGLTNRGCKSDTTTRFKRLGWVRAKTISPLIELGFISNKVDLNVVLSKGANALAQAIIEVLS